MAHRVDSDGSVAGMFSNGNPAGGMPGTRLEEDWLNAVQEELCGLLEAMGVTLAKGTWDQLLTSCVSAATANKIVRRDASGRAAFADPSADGDADTKGARNTAITAAAGTTTRKTADQTFTTSSYADVTDLSFAIAASERVEFEFILSAARSAQGATLGYDITGPAGASGVAFIGHGLHDDTGGQTLYIWGASSFGSGGGYIFAGTAFNVPRTMIRIVGYIVNGATAGTVQLRACNPVGVGTATIHQGSVLRRHAG